MDLLGVIVVVHESAMNITEVEAVLGCDLLGLLASVDDSLHDVMDPDTTPLDTRRTTQDVIGRDDLTH